jgi:hypothetical protein
MALHPDGKLLATGGWSNLIVLHDLTTGKRLNEILTPHGAGVMCLAFTPDGALLASGGYDNKARLWDVKTRREVRSFDGLGTMVYTLAISPDGKFLAGGGFGGVFCLWKLSSGKLLHRAKDHPSMVFRLAFSPDSRLLASVGGDRFVRLWDVNTGRQVDRIAPAGRSGRGEHLNAVAFLPDGRTLVTGDSHSEVRLWEVISGQERAIFAGHEHEIKAVLPIDRGRRLITGSSDSTALVWDATGQGAGPTREFAALWEDLADADAHKAHRAIWALALAPRRSLPLLKERLRPVPREGRWLDRLVADLDHADFATREKATRELESLGNAIEPYLREVLGAKPGAEGKRRIEQMLEKLKGRPTSGGLLRSVRAIEVLEHIGNPEAQELLRKLAGGWPEAPMTKEARAVLARWRRP